MAQTHRIHPESLVHAFHGVYFKGGIQGVVGADGDFFQSAPCQRLGKGGPQTLLFEQDGRGDMQPALSKCQGFGYLFPF